MQAEDSHAMRASHPSHSSISLGGGGGGPGASTQQQQQMSGTMSARGSVAAAEDHYQQPPPQLRPGSAMPTAKRAAWTVRCIGNASSRNFSCIH
jgi:hypothetical protein